MMATTSSTAPTPVPRPGAGLNTDVAHPARRYNYWLGGKDNFAADRISGDAIATVFPHIVTAARENHAFVHRAVQFLAAEHGVRQFLDIGPGLPVGRTTVQIAQDVDPSAQVVYVDNDPLVMAHARALLTSGLAGRAEYLHGDLRRPHEVVASTEVTGTLDLTEPVAVVMAAVLHFLDDTTAAAAVATVMDAMPAGSWLVLSHATADLLDPTVAAQLAGVPDTGITGRRREHVLSFFTGLDLIEPRLIVVSDWRRDPGETIPDASQVSIWGGVARKPTTAAGPS